MAAVRQVVEFSVEELKAFAIEKAKAVLSDNGGKQVQGKVDCDFKYNGGPVLDDSPKLSGVAVFFERAGK